MIRTLSLLGLITVFCCSSAFAAFDTKRACDCRERPYGSNPCVGRSSVPMPARTSPQVSNPRQIFAGPPLIPPPPVLPGPGIKPVSVPTIGPTPVQTLSITRAAAQLNQVEKEIIDQQLEVNEVLRRQALEIEQKRNADKAKADTGDEDRESGGEGSHGTR